MEAGSSASDRTVLVSGLKKRFGEFTAVAGIDFEVRRGEIFGFLGPNGSGKTTTIRMMLGLMRPTAGFIEVLGIPVIKQPEQVRPRTGYMAQQFSLYRDLSVLQNLRFHGTAYGLGNRELTARIVEVLALIGLEDRAQAKTAELSGGWRQRLALGAAMLHRPDVLFLDEPTAGVDPISRRAFWELLYRSAEEGVTIFVTTHYMDEAEHCHRLAFIRRGRIIASGEPDQLRNEIMTETVLELAPDDAAAAVRVLRAAQHAGRLQVSGIEMYGSLVHVLATNVRRQRGAIRRTLRRAGLNPGADAIIEPSLEDVFIASMR